ncbi:glycosyltransferase family 2 protein [Nanoarchaeota archaeon]
MSKVKPKYSMVIPVRNEEKALPKILVEVKKALDKLNGPWEWIIVDNVSTDKSIRIIDAFNAKYKCIRLIRHKYNKGYGGSIKTGVAAANSDTVIIIDADGTYPANEIPNLVKYSKDYVLVNGARTGKHVKIPWRRKPGKFVHTMLISAAAGRHIPDMNSGLRVFNKEAFNKFLALYPDGFSISTTFLLSCVTNGLPVKFLPIDYYKRKGKSKIKYFRDGFNFAMLIVRALTYFNPLKLFLPMGFLFFVAGLGYGIYDFTQNGGVPDISIILIILSFLVGLFGLIADMNSKILIHLNQRR